MLENLNIPTDIEKEPELAIPSIEEQKRIVETLKRLEEAGELTPELLEEYMTGKRTIDEDS
ncbi:ATPase [Photobacterium sp. OFAV2-7]|uniref:ATPase n=1 Tax=Photobacterium sp. OFAV2-7 TaxID=2917748 RepID=UPI001EF50710|nr:ATPase [Photobacterium sp. OFAV2-7]MCG7588299.1 ATPase [Photobacterium sp. OFAV2-7]